MLSHITERENMYSPRCSFNACLYSHSAIESFSRLDAPDIKDKSRENSHPLQCISRCVDIFLTISSVRVRFFKKRKIKKTEHFTVPVCVCILKYSNALSVHRGDVFVKTKLSGCKSMCNLTLPPFHVRMEFTIKTISAN